MRKKAEYALEVSADTARIVEVKKPTLKEYDKKLRNILAKMKDVSWLDPRVDEINKAIKSKSADIKRWTLEKYVVDIH